MAAPFMSNASSRQHQREPARVGQDLLVGDGAVYDVVRGRGGSAIVRGGRYFDELPPDGPLRAPVLYVVICVTINTTVRWLLNLILFIPPLSYFASADSSEVGPIFIGLLALFAGLLVLLPVFSTGYFFVFALIQHGVLRLLAGNNQRGISATLRVLGYATGACKAVSWIPLVNFLIGLYFYYLATTGLRRVHETSTIMALAVALVVPAFWLVLVVFAVLLVSRLSQQGGA